MSLFINKIIVKNNKNIIKKELLSFQKDLSIYIKQHLKLNKIDSSDSSFKDNGQEIAPALSLKIDDRVIIYSNEGSVLADSACENGEILIYEDIDTSKNHTYDKDLKLAIHNKSAYTIVPVNDKYLVLFSYPVFINDEKLGIVRCTRDYSELFSSSKDLLRVITIFILLFSGCIFIFSILLTSKITVPIIKLSNFSQQMAKGNFDVEVNIDTKDEIGELAENFNNMKRQIKNQIETIKKDRDNLKRIEGHRKVFFDNVTHEMKTPLTIISGYSQVLIRKNFKDKDFSKKAVSKIKNESDRMHKMVLDLLEMSKVKTNLNLEEKTDVNLSEIVKSACDDMRIRADKYDISIEKNIEKNIFVLGSQYELRQMMINILDNSIKYGYVKSLIKVRVFKNESCCNIIIEDKGQGIPDDKLNKIFEPFYRVDKEASRQKGSSGLGLAITKEITENHKGHIKVNSVEGIGTKVYIKIPLRHIQKID
jgi:signal transduction histidine kinase